MEDADDDDDAGSGGWHTIMSSEESSAPPREFFIDDNLLLDGWPKTILDNAVDDGRQKQRPSDGCGWCRWNCRRRFFANPTSPLTIKQGSDRQNFGTTMGEENAFMRYVWRIRKFMENIIVDIVMILYRLTAEAETSHRRRLRR